MGTVANPVARQRSSSMQHVCSLPSARLASDKCQPVLWRFQLHPELWISIPAVSWKTRAKGYRLVVLSPASARASRKLQLAVVLLSGPASANKGPRDHGGPVAESAAAHAGLIWPLLLHVACGAAGMMQSTTSTTTGTTQYFNIKVRLSMLVSRTELRHHRQSPTTCCGREKHDP